MTTTHVYQTYIRADIETVFAALTDPAFTRRYFHGTAFTEPPRAGRAYLTVTTDGRPAVDGVIEVLDPPHRLVQTWHPRYDEGMAAEPPSRVEWQLSRAGEHLTLLRLVHGDLAFSPLTWASVRDGWVWVLDALKTLLETGEELPPTADAHDTRDGDPRDGDPPVTTAGDWHRRQGIEANNAVRPLLAAARDGDPTARRGAVRAAHTAAYHWERATGRGPENEARASYMIALAHLAAGQLEPALQAADDALATCRDHALADFDLAYAHEARARVLTALDRRDDAVAAWADALAVPIADAEDRVVVEADFADRPDWAVAVPG